MNQRTSKFLRSKAKELAAVWLRSLLPEAEAALVTTKSVEEFEKGQDKYVHANGRCIVSAYSTRYFYKKLKRAVKRGERPDFRLRSVEELGV